MTELRQKETQDYSGLDKIHRLYEGEWEGLTRWDLAEDQDKERGQQRDLAKQMNVTPGTFSQHLSNAKDKLDSDESTLDAFKTLVALTPVGGSSSKTKRVVCARKMPNAFMLVCEDSFRDRERASPSYEAHFIYRDLDAGQLLNDAPDDITHYDHVSVYGMLSDLGFDIENDQVASLMADTRGQED